MLSMHELSLSMPEPMLSLSMTILAKSSDLGQMICLNSDAYHLTLCYSLHLGCTSPLGWRRSQVPDPPFASSKPSEVRAPRRLSHGHSTGRSWHAKTNSCHCVWQLAQWPLGTTAPETGLHTGVWVHAGVGIPNRGYTRMCGFPTGATNGCLDSKPGLQRAAQK